MPVVTINPSGKTITVAEGSRLLDAVIAAGEKLDHKCSGNAQCGTCHLFLQEGRKSVSKIQRPEHEKLDSLIGVGSKSRLACQVTLGSEDVVVELLGFDSGF
jgi:2Fe-2S ferredoxin